MDQKQQIKLGTLAPPLNSIHRFDNNGHPIYLPPWMSDWLNLNVMVPMIAFIVIVVGILVICIALTRRRVDMRNGPKDVYCRFQLGYSQTNLTSSHAQTQPNNFFYQKHNERTKTIEMATTQFRHATKFNFTHMNRSTGKK